jgi:hypothetical protein
MLVYAVAARARASNTDKDTGAFGKAIPFSFGHILSLVGDKLVPLTLIFVALSVNSGKLTRRWSWVRRCSQGGDGRGDIEAS